MNFFNIYLPKWPQMRVAGQSVTEEQAFDIILKTDTFLTDPSKCSGGNAVEFNAAYREKSGLSRMTTHLKNMYELQDELVGRLQIRTEYVCNEWASCCYVHGAHGWCHPNGIIFYEDNIGKWPTVEEVYNEWCLIAKTFPYLELVATLMSGESCEEDTVPLVNMLVKDGTVNLSEGDLSVHSVYGDLPFRECEVESMLSRLIKGELKKENLELGLPSEWYDRYAEIVKVEVDKLV